MDELNLAKNQESKSQSDTQEEYQEIPSERRFLESLGELYRYQNQTLQENIDLAKKTFGENGSRPTSPPRSRPRRYLFDIPGLGDCWMTMEQYERYLYKHEHPEEFED